MFNLVTLILTFVSAEASVIKLGPCIIKYGTSCDNDYVKFYLFTGNGTKEYVEINDTYHNISLSKFNPKMSTKILIHGYDSDINLAYLDDVKNEYLKSEPMNVWMIDWSPLVAAPCYLTAVYNVRYVGTCLALLVNRLGNPSNLHVIGFSLGAHVPSHAAKLIHPETLSRVTGLDPAMPLFEPDIFGNRLDKSSAEFVDVIHTNSLLQGDVTPLGHVDFYANSVVYQPGCLQYSNPLGCDHFRALLYFAESINSQKGFWSWTCVNLFEPPYTATCAASPPYHLVGEHVNTSLTGSYFFRTASQSPFALGKTVKTIEIPGGNNVIVYFKD